MRCCMGVGVAIMRFRGHHESSWSCVEHGVRTGPNDGLISGMHDTIEYARSNGCWRRGRLTLALRIVSVGGHFLSGRLVHACNPARRASRPLENISASLSFWN